MQSTWDEIKSLNLISNNDQEGPEEKTISKESNEGTMKNAGNDNQVNTNQSELITTRVISFHSG